jgi:hypothetical protein
MLMRVMVCSCRLWLGAAQLRNRHWAIFDRATETTSHVRGPGVVGMYPLLREVRLAPLACRAGGVP